MSDDLNRENNQSTPKPDSMKFDTVRKRVLYRAWHRGTKELDLILGRFCQAHINEFDHKELLLFEKLLENEENILQAWLMGQIEIPLTEQGKILRRIRDFHLDDKNETNTDKNGVLK